MNISLPFLSAALVAVTAFPALSSSAPDTLYLKDNTIRIGKIVSRDSDYTSLRTNNENLLISNGDIIRIGHAAPSNQLLPGFGIQVSGGISFPQQLDFPSNFGIRACARYMIFRSVGIYASINYATWEINFDTLKVYPNQPIKGPHDTTTETFAVTAVSPRIGAFFVSPLSATAQLLLGFDVGETFFGASDQDSSVAGGGSFSYALRADFRFSVTDQFALLLGAQFESFQTDYTYLESHSFATGANRRLGDIVLSAGMELGF